MSKPQLGGDGWRALFTPVRNGAYVNDHCVVRGPTGRWHVFGITEETPDIDPHQERWFCHGSGPSLAGGAWKEHGRVCDDPRLESWHEAPCSLVGAPQSAVMRDGMIFRLDDDT